MAEIITDLVCAIDPGANGAIVIYTRGGVKAFNMPTDMSRLYLLFKDYSPQNPCVFLEKVQMYHSDKDGKQFGIVKMLANYEGVKAACMIANWPVIPVYPISWQSALKLPTRGMGKADRKAFYKAEAQSRYPGIHVTLKNADALLILEFAKRKLLTDPQWVIEQLKPKSKFKRPNKQKHIL